MLLLLLAGKRLLFLFLILHEMHGCEMVSATLTIMLVNVSMYTL